MAARDTIAGVDPGATGPAGRAYAVTPSDSVDLDPVPRAIYVGGTGDLTVEIPGAGGAPGTVTFAAVPAGTLLPIRPSKIKAASTATAIVAVY